MSEPRLIATRIGPAVIETVTVKHGQPVAVEWVTLAQSLLPDGRVCLDAFNARGMPSDDVDRLITRFAGVVGGVGDE